MDIKARQEHIVFSDISNSISDDPTSNSLQYQHNIVDILRTAPSQVSFVERVKKIGLSKSLEEKILLVESHGSSLPPMPQRLLENDEKELAGEMLLRRHTFTRLIFENNFFRQAALTIIQNIYLFRQRKIFFGTPAEALGDRERQEALLLFTLSPHETTLPLAKTFQHLVLARVWHRIVSQASDSFLGSRPFVELHEVVEQINTLRNVYMLLSRGIVGKITSHINSIYRQSITPEDGYQIGSFGIARAAYRFHPSSGFRFSTYASHWILKEIQRQALEGRLIRISANLVERIASNAQCGNSKAPPELERLCRATPQLYHCLEDLQQVGHSTATHEPAGHLEKNEILDLLQHAIRKILTPKSADVIMRRYGLGKYSGNEQSVIEIAAVHGVTRSSIYQVEQTALQRLRKYLRRHTDFSSFSTFT